MKKICSNDIVKKLILMIVALLELNGCASKPEADLMVHHAKLLTVVIFFSVQETFAEKGRKLVAVGTYQEIMDTYYV